MKILKKTIAFIKRIVLGKNVMSYRNSCRQGEIESSIYIEMESNNEFEGKEILYFEHFVKNVDHLQKAFENKSLESAKLNKKIVLEKSHFKDKYKDTKLECEAPFCDNKGVFLRKKDHRLMCEKCIANIITNNHGSKLDFRLISDSEKEVALKMAYDIKRMKKSNSASNKKEPVKYNQFEQKIKAETAEDLKDL